MKLALNISWKKTYHSSEMDSAGAMVSGVYKDSTIYEGYLECSYNEEVFLMIELDFTESATKTRIFTVGYDFMNRN